MPVAMGLMALVFAWKASDRWWGRAIALLAIPAAFSLGLLSPESTADVWPLARDRAGRGLVGAPVFVAMGGIALVLFFKEGTPVSSVTGDVYRLMVPRRPCRRSRCSPRAATCSPKRTLPTGWCASSAPSSAGCRAASRCWWRRCARCSPPSPAAPASPSWRSAACSIRSCARTAIPEGFSLGLVTASGSLGLLFPPSLPVILYAVVASSRDRRAADQLYVAGLLPGLLLVVLVALYGIVIGRQVGESGSRSRGARRRRPLAGQVGAVGAVRGRRAVRQRVPHAGRERRPSAFAYTVDRRVLHHARHPHRSRACPRCCSRPPGCAAPCSSC